MPVASSQVASSTTNVLLIDGHREEREYWKHHLTISSLEYVVFEADTGAAGLDICQSQLIDCVVTELNLPDMSGFELLVHIVARLSKPDIAVIMLTHTTIPAMATFALNMGAQAYLIKSCISGGYLDAVIRKAIVAAGPISKKAAFDVIGFQRGAGRTG